MIAALAGCVAAVHPVSAQAVLENDSLRVELIGLRRWTVPMIEDSLHRYAPTSSLLSHACAVALRQIGFADASATYYRAGTGGGTKEFVVVSLVEPQDSARIRYRAPLRDTLRATELARTVVALLETHQRASQQLLRRSTLLLAATSLAPADTFLAPALPLRAFLAANRSASARRSTYGTLASDGNDTNRVAATILLANFHRDDRAWWALVEGLRDPATPVNVASMQLLHGLAADRARRVDWTPAVVHLRAVLDGTNLFAHNDLLEALVATRVSPRLAKPLLVGGGQLVLAKLRSSAPRERDLARRFLIQLAGRDLGESAGSWEAWMGSLR